jgi:hypothetical protein
MVHPNGKLNNMCSEFIMGKKYRTLSHCGLRPFLSHLYLAQASEKEAREIKSCFYLIIAQKFKRWQFPRQQSESSK